MQSAAISHPEPLKKKKPPACDRCKAKRVLCHPNPAGCPRCVEKGVDCTTTPVVRRKPQRRSARPTPAPSPAPISSLPPPSTSASTDSALQSLSTSTSSPLTAFLADEASTVASTSAIPYPQPTSLTLDLVPLSLPLISLNGADYDPDTQLASACGGPGVSLEEITVDMAKHFYYCFEQSSVFDHTLFRHYKVRDLFTSCQWKLCHLAPSERVLAYTACTLGALFSFDPVIIGSASPRPTALEQIQPGDLRAFGTRRMGACRRMRNEAERMAKREEVLFECSVANAATCMMLDALSLWEQEDDIRLHRPWLSAYMAHLRVLADTQQIKGVNTLEDRTYWSIHLSADVLSELDTGKLTATRADHLALTGEDVPDLVQLDNLLKETLKHELDHTTWPDIRPIPMLFLALARELAEKVLGTHARREPLSEPVLTSFLTHFSHFRSICTSFALIASKLCRTEFSRSSSSSTASPKSSALFPHAGTKAKRVRWHRKLALGGMRNFVIYTWTSLTLPLYHELRRRQSIASDTARTAARLGEEVDYPTRQAHDRLFLAVKHARELCLVALEAKLEGLETVPNMAAFPTMRKVQIMDWVSFVLEEVDEGRVEMDGKWAGTLERISLTLRTAGYVCASPQLDNFILRLDSHALAFRLSQADPVLPHPPSLQYHTQFGARGAVQQQHPAPTASTSVDFSLALGHSAPALENSVFTPSSSLDTSFASLINIPTPSHSRSEQFSASYVSSTTDSNAGFDDAFPSAFPTGSASARVSSISGSMSASISASTTPGMLGQEFHLLDETLAGLIGADAEGGEGSGIAMDNAAGMEMEEWGLW
ncbi:hypothetical protein JCM11641_003563 [Rhodosporidiobolus odoratus]